MEEHDDKHVHEPNNPLSGTWVLITSGPMRIFGRVSRLGRGEGAKAIDNEVAVDEVLAADYISLRPALDFFAPLRPVPAMGKDNRPIIRNGAPLMTMSRDPIVTTRDFTFKPFPVHVRSGPGVTFDFVSQMHADDQKTYHDFIRQALGMAREESAHRSGLHLPSNKEVLEHG